jgi:tetratricopeptide (TPR) repeat protein
MKQLYLIFVCFFLFINAGYSVNLRTEAKKHKALAEKFFADGNFENAVSEYKKVMSYAPEMESEISNNFKKAQLNFAISLIDKDKKRAVQLLKELIYYHKDYAVAYYYLGYISEKDRDYDYSEKYYHSFLDLEKLDIKKKDEIRIKLEQWTTDRTSYQKGLNYMSKGDFESARSEFKKIKEIKKDNADNFIKKIDNILNSSIEKKVETENKLQDIGVGKQKILELFKKAIESEDSSKLSSLISDNFVSSIGNKDNFISYWKDYWFLFFQNIEFSFSNVNETKISEKESFLTFTYKLSGIYNGKDMTLFKPEFKFGREYSIDGNMMLVIKEENGKWKIIE